jgi:hypothetical protein
MPNSDLTLLTAEVVTCREVHDLPGDWPPSALSELLEALEIEADGAGDADVSELVLMALGDLEPHEAGEAVLKQVFGAGMSAGVRSNLAGDLENERPWEEFADLARQRGIFTAVALLQKALPRRYGKPDAMRAVVAFTAPTPPEAALLARAEPAVILRALAPGLGPRSIVTRLYAEGLRGGAFPEAAHILWHRALTADAAEPRRVVADICGAHSFFAALDDAPPWEARVVLRPVG